MGPFDNVDKILQELNSRLEIISDWERGFLESVVEQWERKHSLSYKQMETLESIYGKYDEETIAKLNAWEAAWDDEKKEKAKVVAEYYIANPPYFSQVANKILNDPDFIPPEKQYKKMTENKYAQRVLDITYSNELYPLGALIQFRKIQHNRSRQLDGKLGIVIEVCPPKSIRSNAKGARDYRVLPQGSTHPVKTQERYIMDCKAARDFAFA